ncbi:MAG: hypothetical protein QOG56_2926 [Solirubrobacteraceae bacterium]|jgi:hypothetical protein|nr:hypothetical protein [Solirubrobacteraceae bacterium]
MKRVFGSGRYANVTATMALIVALGGTSYAAVVLPANSVGSRQIKKGGVANSDIRANAVTSGKVKNGSLLSADFKAGQLPAGPKGATGATGATGAKGDKGDKGDTGAPGSLTGAASGVLSGNYPGPGFATDVNKLIPVAIVYVTAAGVVSSEAHRAPVTGPPTAAKGGTGIYDITLPGVGFYFADDVANCSPADGNGNTVGLNSISGTQLRAFVRNDAGTAVDGALYCSIYDIQ